MIRVESHISRVAEAISEWLNPENSSLKRAAEQTAADGLFGLADIKHRLRVLRDTLKQPDILTWAKKSGLEYPSMKGKRILCLHAGNLPLVGIQDLLSVVLTGGTYLGKLSRNDPYLTPTLFDILASYELLGIESEWATDLTQLTSRPADAVLFAGSAATQPVVEKRLKELQFLTGDTPKLMRTAHFSVAYIEDNAPRTMEDLTEAVFRYGGAGCRSVAVVVAPFHLDSEKCTFTDYIESFWLTNPQHEEPPPSLHYRYAYNKAVMRPQAWLDRFLIEETDSKPREKFVLHWVKGDLSKLEEILDAYDNDIQSVYSTADHIGKQIGRFRVEPLSLAQMPPAWWRPDRVDTIDWLQQQVRS